MTAVAMKQQTTSAAIRVSGGRHPDLQEIVRSNYLLVKALAKRPVAEIDVQGVPDDVSDLYRRRINVIKSPLAVNEMNPPADTMPTLEDVAFTDLPWLGYVTAAPYGSRQFRSRNALMASVEVVREIDGYLYSLCCDVGRKEFKLDPAIVEIEGPTRRDTAYKLKARRPGSAEEFNEHFGKAPLIPPTLKAELEGLGYVLEGNKFILPAQNDVSTTIIVYLYGKIITPI